MAQQSHASRYLIRALAPVYEALADFAYPLMRVTVGALYIPHGYAKLFGGKLDGTVALFTAMSLEPARALAVYVGCVEFLGGILIVLGLATRPAAALAAINLLVAALYVHGAALDWLARGYEFPLMWGILMLVIVIRGGHHRSLDRLIGREI